MSSPSKMFSLTHLFYVIILIALGQSHTLIQPTTQRNSDGKNQGCDGLKAPTHLVSAIVGGVSVHDISNVPYIAAVGERSRTGTIHWTCGGVLLSDKIVLTAGHCLKRRPHVVRLGGTSLLPNASSLDIGIERTIPHPEYRFPRSYHDLAILVLAKPAKISKEVRPICLAGSEAGKKPGATVSVMGWGAKSIGGLGANHLRRVDVQVYSHSDCNKVYSKREMQESFPRGISDQQLCAGSITGGKDACQGDSGGPLVIEDENHVVRLLGIVSAGFECGRKDFPGVYVRVSSYKSWIEKYV